LILPISALNAGEKGAYVQQVLENLGAEVRVVTADVAAVDDLQRVWHDAETEFGKVHGVIHAEETQGENAFRSILEATRDDCARHFRSKAHPLYALHGVLRRTQCDFCLLLSSMATVLGGVGYGPYTAANCFMDAFVSYANQTSLTPWLSVNWDLWVNEENGEQVTSVRADLAQLAMVGEEGEDAFARVLSQRGVERILVSTADIRSRQKVMRQRLDRLGSGRDPDKGQSTHPRPALATSFVAAETELERRIAAVWESALGFDRIGVEDNFFDLGGDSLIAIRVTARLTQELGIEFPAARLYQGATVRALAQILGESREDGTSRRATEFADRKEAAARRRDFIEAHKSRMVRAGTRGALTNDAGDAHSNNERAGGK